MAGRKESRSKAHARYKGMVDHARQWRDEEGYDDLWWRMIDLYRGKQVVELTEEDRITVNISFGTINVIYPSVSVNYPKITVNPNKPEDEDKAIITEAMINWAWKHYDYQTEFRSAVKDYLMLGHGWVKIGWAYKEKPVLMSDQDRDEELTMRLADADAYAAEHPEMASQLPTDDEIQAHLTDTKLVVTEDQPFVERVSPFDIYVDPAATSLKEARFVAQRIIRPLEEVRSDESYKKSVRRSVKGDMESYTHRDERQWAKRDRQTPEVEYCTIWEFYDLGKQLMCVWAEGAADYLVDPHPLPFAYGHPFVMLRNYDIPEYFYPMGDLEALESLQMELNKTRSQMMQARKKFGRKYLYRESAFDAAGRQALETEQDNSFVPVADEGTPFQDLIQPLQQVPLPPEIYNHSEMIENDIATVSGVSEYQRGQIPETRRTATEAAIISDSVTARAADKLAVIELGLGVVARRVVQVMQQFTTGEQIFSVQGQDASLIWVPWEIEDIRGEFDFEVEAGSTQPMNETVRRQTAVALSQALSPFIGLVVDPAAVARYLLQFGFGIKNPSKFMIDPMMAMLQQQQGMPPEGEQPPGVGGNQGPPMGGGYIDQETGNTSTQEADQAQMIPPELLNQLAGQVGLRI